MVRSKRSFKKLLFQYSILAIFSISLITLAQYAFMFKTFEKYDEFLRAYEDLNAYYSSLERAHISYKDYLYAGTTDTYSLYEKEMNIAICAIEKVKDDFYTVGASDVIWRFNLLQNMTFTYKDTANKIKIEKENHSQLYEMTYDELQKIYEVTMKTSDEYYDIVTTEVSDIKFIIDKNKQMMLSLSSLFLLTFTLGASAYFYYLLKSITRPLSLLVDNIQDIKDGQYDLLRVPVNTLEMEVLCLALQDLADSIYDNIEAKKEKLILEKKLLIQENENLRKDETLAQSEVKIMQAQLNPHFLFNTLNMIYLQAIKENATITVSMLEKMTECMRYTLHRKFQTSTLQLEITFIRNYLFIQSKRFEDRIEFVYHVQENLPNVPIPAMIIEPIIENSLKHGLSNAAEDGMITIFITADTSYVFIKISDNGKGIDAEQAENMMSQNFASSKQQDNLGLENIKKRLEMLYENEAFISISSMEGCGFETLISIPIHCRIGED